MLAVASNGREEWIGVFMLTVLVAMAITVVFFVAQFRADQSRAAGSVAKWSLIIFAVLGAILAAATIGADGIDQIGKDSADHRRADPAGHGHRRRAVADRALARAAGCASAALRSRKRAVMRSAG